MSNHHLYYRLLYGVAIFKCRVIISIRNISVLFQGYGITSFNDQCAAILHIKIHTAFPLLLLVDLQL
jgi:hypothetical protein